MIRYTTAQDSTGDYVLDHPAKRIARFGSSGAAERMCLALSDGVYDPAQLWWLPLTTETPSARLES